MAHEIAGRFKAGIDSARVKLSQMDEACALAPIRLDGWNSKQILGHLIDSALNNHQRFVRASIDGKYEGPDYRQQPWVDAHGYAQMPWSGLVEHWSLQNELLCAVVERIPESKLGAPCKIGSDTEATLGFVVDDYVTHLHHHADQIAGVVTPSRLFLNYSVEKMEQMLAQVRECVGSLSDEQMWQRSGENANAIGNLLLHLSGNIRQWIGHGVAGSPDIRVRDAEFEARGGRSTAEVLGIFERTVTETIETVKALPLARLTERTKPQNRDVSVLEAVYQVTGHLMLHTGQIVFATKQMTGKDLGFFSRAQHTAR